MNIIIKSTFILLILLHAITAFTQENKNVEPRLILMTIRYVDLEIETPIRVDCNTFPYYFGSMIKEKVILDDVFLNDFDRKLSEIKEEYNENSLDVRVQIQLSFNNGRPKMLCFGKFENIMVFECETLPFDSELLSPILKIVKEEK